MTPVVHHIPVCPFSQRLEILLELKGRRGAVAFQVVDITVPRPPGLLALTGGSTALPVLELEDGRALRESLILMGYLEDTLAPAIRRADPFERAVEGLLVAHEGRFGASGYALVMNQDRARREHLVARYLAEHEQLDVFLRRHGSTDRPWLFDRFGWAEAVFTPLFQRFAFVRYYEDVDLPDSPRFARVRAWRDACRAHPAAQQVTEEEIVKLYYDYSRNAGNGALAPGRQRSSFVLEPDWRRRPWPPRGKDGPGATDLDLGLILAEG